MVTVILDTAVLVDVYRNRKRAADTLITYKNNRFAITIFTYTEFLAGAALLNKKDARKFLKDYPVINFDANSASILKTMCMQYLLPSKHLGDFLIAASAMANKAAVITPNYKDFSKFKNLEVIRYLI